MSPEQPDSAGFKLTLRHALATEMMLRLRPMMLHTLKGPTQTIVAALHMLQKSPTGEVTPQLAANRQRYVDWIKEAATKMGGVAESLLPHRLGMAAEPEPCDLAELTEDVAHLFRDEAALAGVEFRVEAGARIPSIRVHCEELKLALSALLCGVLDRSPQETILKITLAHAYDTIEWRVSIPSRPDAANPSPKAFELRFDSAPPQPAIGWHVARDIVQEHGGNVTVEDHGQEGWTLRLRLPSYLPGR